MKDLLDKLSHCVEFGKINLASPYPPDMKGLEGADELARSALNDEFRKEIGADFYSPDPQGAVEYLNKIADNLS